MEKQKNSPKLRFPEFKGEWERKKLGEVAEISSGGTPSRTNPLYWNGHIPWVSTTLIDFNFIDYVEEYITEEGLKNSSAKLFPVGTLLIAMYGQGKTRGKIAVLNIEASTNQACGAITTNPNLLDSLFAFQNIAKRYDEIRDLSNLGGQENLSGGILKGIEISFPSLPEQKRIASFFTALDQKIAELKQKKNLLEQYKKGVMQKLFSQALRFKDEKGKEFPKWEKKRLGEVCDKKSSNISANKIEENFGEYIIYGASGILKKVDFYREEEEYISIVKDGAGVGRVFLCAAKSSVLGTLDIIKPIGGNLHYLFYFLQQTNFIKYVTGSTIPHIYFSDYKTEKILFPCIKEQTKIANFLIALDEKINRTENQLQQTQAYKKGLLQKMFV